MQVQSAEAASLWRTHMVGLFFIIAYLWYGSGGKMGQGESSSFSDAF